MSEKRNSSSPEISDDQIDALAEGKLHTSTLHDIYGLERQIRSALDGAGKFLSDDEKKAFEAKVQRFSTDKAGLNHLHGEIQTTIEQSKVLFSKFENSINGSSLSAKVKAVETEEFMKLSLPEKKIYIQQRLDDLRTLAESIGEIDEADLRIRLEELQKLSPKEIKKQKDANIHKYRRNLLANKKFFREESIRKHLAEFKIRSLHGQQEWLDAFPRELDARQLLHIEFEQYSSEYQNLFPNFEAMSRKEKRKALKSLERVLVEDARSILHKPQLARHTSEKTKKGYINFMEGKTIQGTKAAITIQARENALRHMEANIKGEAELGYKFEKFPEKYQKLHADFFKLDFDGKNKIIKKLELTEKQENERTAEYESLLLKEKEDNVISETTFKKYLNEFKKLKTAKEQEYYESEFKNEMRPRRDLLEKWKNLPAKLTNPLQDTFDQGSGTERKKLYLRLNPNDKEVQLENSRKREKSAEHAENPQIFQLLMQAQKSEEAQNFDQALMLYETILDIDPEHKLSHARIQLLRTYLGLPQLNISSDESMADKDETAQISHTEAKHAVEQAMAGETMKAKRRRLTMQHIALRLQQKSEQRNAGASDVRKRNAHLTSFETKLNEQLYERHHMTLQKGKATDVHTYDTTKFMNGGLQDQEFRERMWLYGQSIDPQKTTGNDVEIVNDGKKLTTGEAKILLQRQEKKAREEIVKIATGTTQDQERNPDRGTHKEIKKAMDTTDIQIDLKA